MLQAVVFDFDGVIADSEPLHYRAFLETLKPLGVNFDYGVYQDRYIGYDDRDAIRAIAADFRLSIGESDLPDWVDRKLHVFADLVAGGAVAVPGAVELIRHLASRLPLAIASGARLADIQAILPHLGCADCFRTIVTADDVARSKPDPESYRMAADRLGIAPGQCLAIEDTPAGLTSARSAGLRRLGLTTTHSAESLRPHAEHVVDTLVGLHLDELNQRFA